MDKLKSKLLNLTPILLFVGYLIWWIYINYIDPASKTDFDTQARNDFTDTYSLVALAGSVAGFFISKKWGMLKSIFGRAIFYFSLGLLFQFLGQLVYGIAYRAYGIELASPGLGDIPYVLSYVSYLVGAHQLLRTIVFKGPVLKPWWVLVTTLGAVVAVVILESIMFLNLAVNDDRGLTYGVLNVAYAAIQLPYFTVALIALLHSKRMSGGLLFRPVAVLLVALGVQFFADFSYLNESYHETWAPASFNDISFLSAYILMTISIIMIDAVRKSTLEVKMETTNES